MTDLFWVNNWSISGTDDFFTCLGLIHNVIEFQKHSQKQNRFTTENEPMVVARGIISMVNSVLNLWSESVYCWFCPPLIELKLVALLWAIPYKFSDRYYMILYYLFPHMKIEKFGTLGFQGLERGDWAFIYIGQEKKQSKNLWEC